MLQVDPHGSGTVVVSRHELDIHSVVVVSHQELDIHSVVVVSHQELDIHGGMPVKRSFEMPDHDVLMDHGHPGSEVAWSGALWHLGPWQWSQSITLFFQQPNVMCVVLYDGSNTWRVQTLSLNWNNMEERKFNFFLHYTALSNILYHDEHFCHIWQIYRWISTPCICRFYSFNEVDILSKGSAIINNT